MSTSFPPAKPFPPDPPPRRGTSCAVWLLIGCGGAGLLGVVLCGGLAFFGFRWGMDQVNAMSKEFEDQGYQRQMGQVVQVDKSPAQKTVYVAQVVQITKDVDVDIALICQVAEIKADVHGDVDFMGQILTLDAGRTIDGDLRIKNAQSVEIKGEVKGEISGNYMVLRHQGKSYGSGQSPSSRMEPVPDQPAVSPEQPLPAEKAQPPEAEVQTAPKE
jgi:hypothetical protein